MTTVDLDPPVRFGTDWAASGDCAGRRWSGLTPARWRAARAAGHELRPGQTPDAPFAMNVGFCCTCGTWSLPHDGGAVSSPSAGYAAWGEHVAALSASPTEEPAMPARSRKPVTTAAEAAAAPPLAVVPDQPSPAELAAAEADQDPAVIAGLDAVRASDERIAAGKKRRAAKAPAAGAQALLTSAEAGAAAATFLPAVPLHRIRPAADNPRSSLPDLEELRDSIAEHGVLEPLVIAQAGVEDGAPVYDLVFGHRRLAAAGLAGLPTVPAVLRDDLVDQRARVVRLVENLQRADLSPLDEARGLRELVDGGMKQKDVAVAISRNPSHVTKRLQLLTLPEAGQRLVDQGVLSIEQGVELAKLPADAQARVLAVPATAPAAIASRIDSEAQAAKAAAELRKVEAELEVAGISVVRFESYPQLNPTDGPYPLDRMRNAPEAWKVPARHDKLACHVAIVAPPHTLPYRSPDELADDPLSRFYVLGCSAPESHVIAAPAGDAAKPQWQLDREAAEAEREARAAAAAELLSARWGHACRLAAAKPSKANQAARLEYVLRIATWDALVMYDADDNGPALAVALLAGDPAPAPAPYSSEPHDRAGFRDALAALGAGGAQLEAYAYALALGNGYDALRSCLRHGSADRVDVGRSTAALFLRHLADDSGGGIPADPAEQQIALEGANLEAVLVDLDLLVRPVEDLELPPHPEDATAVPDEGSDAEILRAFIAEQQPLADAGSETAAREVADAQRALAELEAEEAGAPDELAVELARAATASERRAALGVTPEAAADYGVRLGGGEAYLVPGIKTAKGQCRACHAQVPIRSGGVAGKHTNDAGPCSGVGEPVMTIDEALPVAAGDAAPAVDEEPCPTCQGVGRDAADRLCDTCRGRGLIAPQLQPA